MLKWSMWLAAVVMVTGPSTAFSADDACDGFGVLDGQLDTDDADAFLTGAHTRDFFGRSVARVGDINGDGFEDLAVGAPGVDTTGSDAGAAYLFLGPINDTDTLSADTADVVINGSGPYGYLGWTVAAAGDLDLDGYDDVIVGAPSRAGSSTPTGYAVVIGGSANLPSLIDASSDSTAMLLGATSGDQFGFSAATVGDLNGDGFPEVIIGAPENDVAGKSAGAAYVFGSWDR